MSHHSSLPEPPARSPNPSFSAWLKRHALLFIGEIIGVISAIASTIYYVAGAYEHTERTVKDLNEFLSVFFDSAHLVFIFGFICALIPVLEKNDLGSYRVGRVFDRVFNLKLPKEQLYGMLRDGQTQVEQFKRYFLFFWIAMFTLYVAFLGKHLSTSDNLEPSINSLADLTVAYAYPFLTFALNNASVWCIFLCFTVLYKPALDERSRRERNSLVRFSLVALCLLVLSHPLVIFSQSSQIIHDGAMLKYYFTCFDAISGILNALVLAMLIAKLDSHFIGLRPWLILILYGYSAVQPLFTVFELPDVVFKGIQTLVLITVFLLKVYFFLIIYYALQTGRMLNYIFCTPTLSRLVDSIFENQYEIKEQRESESFTFHITDDNQDLYLTDESFKSRESCVKH